MPRLALGAGIVFGTVVLSVYGTYRLVAHAALERYPASPPVYLSAAMAGLFVGGIVAVLGIVVLARSR